MNSDTSSTPIVGHTLLGLITRPTPRRTGNGPATGKKKPLTIAPLNFQNPPVHEDRRHPSSDSPVQEPKQEAGRRPYS